MKIQNTNYFKKPLSNNNDSTSTRSLIHSISNLMIQVLADA